LTKEGRREREKGGLVGGSARKDESVGDMSHVEISRVAHCNTVQHTAAHCSTLQHTAAHCSTLQNFTILCNTLQHTVRVKGERPDGVVQKDEAVKDMSHKETGHVSHCKTPQHTAAHCNKLQHTAAHYNALQR